MEMLDGEAALKAAGVARLGLPGLGQGKGREGLRHRSGARWAAWKGARRRQPNLGAELPRQQVPWV